MEAQPPNLDASKEFTIKFLLLLVRGIDFRKDHFSIRNRDVPSHGEHFLKDSPDKGRVMSSDDGVNVSFLDIGAKKAEKLSFMSEIL